MTYDEHLIYWAMLSFNECFILGSSEFMVYKTK